MASEKPLDKRMAYFVCFHLADKYAFAPFTGQDFSAWKAFLYGVELYGRGDYEGQRNALGIMRAAVRAAQRKVDVMAIFKKSIPGVLDWGDEARLWLLVGPPARDGEASRPSHDNETMVMWPCSDGERICEHLQSRPSKKHAGYFHCKDCGAEWRHAERSESELSSI
jgi:hypothetical protein